MNRLSALLAALAASTTALCAGVAPTESLRYLLPDEGVTYDALVPEPEAFFGFATGDWHLRHHELLAYYRALAAAAPGRVLLEEIGTTYGRRAKILLTIASSENRARLDALRVANVRNALGDARTDGSPPVVVWLGYSIHGNEPSGAHAATVIAYHLAAGNGPAVDSLLENSVVLIDPFLNPDGIDRFADWSNNHRGRIPNTDPAHREHAEAWPSGRTNYYWHDLNRDWLPAVMPESHAHLATFHRWRPALFCDFHEMGTADSYFFQPGIPMMVNPITPAGNQELTAKLALHHAAALDAIDSLYYTGERFDDFYIGKGSTYPDVLGSVGVLFEQASARGHSQDSPSGVVSLRFGIRNQVRASLSSLQGAMEMRTELLRHQFDSADSARREAAAAATKAYVFSAPGDGVRLAKFAAWLGRHEVRFRVLTRDLETNGAIYKAGESLVVALAQPSARLITAMFEKRTEFLSNAFYDVSAWNMAEAYGLDWSPLETGPEESMLGPESELPQPPAERALGEKGVALAFTWSGFNAPRAAWRFLGAEARLRVSMQPFTAVTGRGEAAFPAGTIVVPYGIQTSDTASLRDLARSIAAKEGVAIDEVLTGLTPAGIDIGSPSMRPVETPSIALVSGDGANIYCAGYVWHLFDRELGIPVSLVTGGQLIATTLERYSTVIFSDGRFQGNESLKRWVEDGGTLIATGAAIRALAEAKWAPVELLTADFPEERVAFADARENNALRLIAGTIVEAMADLTHPIAFGFGRERIALMRTRDIFLKPTTNPLSSPLLYAAQPLVSGFMSDPNAKALAGSAAVQVHHLGRGRIILMPDAPAFRSHWHGTSRLLVNAIFFGPLMKEFTSSIDE